MLRNNLLDRQNLLSAIDIEARLIWAIVRISLIFAVDFNGLPGATQFVYRGLIKLPSYIQICHL